MPPDAQGHGLQHEDEEMPPLVADLKIPTTAQQRDEYRAHLHKILELFEANHLNTELVSSMFRDFVVDRYPNMQHPRFSSEIEMMWTDMQVEAMNMLQLAWNFNQAQPPDLRIHPPTFITDDERQKHATNMAAAVMQIEAVSTSPVLFAHGMWATLSKLENAGGNKNVLAATAHEQFVKLLRRSSVAKALSTAGYPDFFGVNSPQSWMSYPADVPPHMSTISFGLSTGKAAKMYFIVTAKRGNKKISGGNGQATYFCQNYTNNVCTVSGATPSTVVSLRCGAPSMTMP